jgi:crotonobetainyl-CoA:carnitine CoA-transferase CaiB-like acyl-CoA transferase
MGWRAALHGRASRRSAQRRSDQPGVGTGRRRATDLTSVSGAMDPRIVCAAMADRLLDGVRVVDLCGEPGALAGRILADLGAHVTRVLPVGEDGVQPVATLGGHDAWRTHAWSAGCDFAYGDEALHELLPAADVVLDTPGWPGTYTLDAQGSAASAGPDGLDEPVGPDRIDPAVVVGHGAPVGDLGPDRIDRARAAGAVWVSITPFGLDGPRAGWRASDLGVMAASGNLWCTGDADRPPVRCAEPIAYAHTGPEAAFAALSGLATGRAQRVDLSMQEVVLVANMGGPGRFVREGDRGRRRGASIGRSREIWPCADGWVSFGIRGGRARVGTWAAVAELAASDGIDVAALVGRDWAAFNHNNAEADELAAIAAVVEQWFARHTMAELYAWACEHDMTLAPVNSPREILASEQLASRGFFGPVGDVDRFPRAFVQVRSVQADLWPVAPPAPPPPGESPVTLVAPRRAGTPAAGADPAPAEISAADVAPNARFDAEIPSTPAENTSPGGQAPPGGEAAPAGEEAAPGGKAARRETTGDPAGGAWAGTTIVEFGSGAAGPIATRFFAEHGATVIRVESAHRPDFLRAYALGPKNPHGLDGAPMFDALNPGKLSIALDLKSPEGREIAFALVDRADAVTENFAPRAMAGLGLDYDTLAERRPDVVMLSACLNGQTGPHRDYPGFGGQGAALAGFNFLTGWPDREPIGPYGTITDSLAPRFAAATLAAALLYRRRTGRGCYLDLSQVEAGTWALGPWLLRYATAGTVVERRGNRHEWACPHGVFPCAGDDRWVAIAAWTNDEWTRLAGLIDLEDPSLSSAPRRQARADEVEAAVAAWTSSRDATEVAERLQALGIEAVPVQDFGDCAGDPQLAHRGHFEDLEHPRLGPGHYERNGFRLSEAPSGYGRASPLLGQHTHQVLADVLGYDDATIERFAASGALA